MLPRTLLVSFASFLFACSSADFAVAPGVAPLDVFDVQSSDSGLEAAEAGSETPDTSELFDSDVVRDSSSSDVLDTGVADTGTVDTGTDVAHDAALEAALEACEPLPTKDAPHCAVGETCAVNTSHKTYCRTVNTAATSEMTCTFDTDCNVNAVCFFAVGASSGKCMLFCRSDADCCSGGPCSTGFNCKKTPLIYTSPVTGSTYGTCRT